MLIDTHAHLNFSAYKDDSDEVIRRSLDNNVWMINVGSQYTTSKRAVEIAQKYDKGVYAAVGLHPIHLENQLIKVKVDKEEIEFNTEEEEFAYEKYRALAQSEKVVAVGEIGLDYYYRPKTKRKLELFKEKQRTVLSQQLKLAEEVNLPVIFHCRMGHKDLIDFLDKENSSRCSGVIHCFTGDWEQARKYLEMGFYLGFNGIIFKSDLPLCQNFESGGFDEIIRKTPLERTLIETDCPYLTPPLPAEALVREGFLPIRNEPIYLKYIAEKIAGIKNISCEQIVEITTKNAKELFKI